MFFPKRSRRHGLVIRSAGMALIPAGCLAIYVLHGLIHGSPQHEAIAELGLAAMAFACLSFGSALLALGGHIFDDVEISQRWRSGASLPERTPAVSERQFAAERERPPAR